MCDPAHVWITNPYGNLPSYSWRPTRGVLLAKTLVDAGFDVTWFTSAFNHTRKEFYPSSLPVADESGIRYRLVSAYGYRKNIGVGRLFSEAMFAVRLTLESRRETCRPNLIIAGHATLFSGLASVLLAKRYGVPLVIDMYDLWPEVFQLAFPSKLRWFARFVLSPLYWLRRQIFTQADAVIALARINLEVAASAAQIARKDRCLLVYEGIDIKNALKEDPAADVSHISSLLDTTSAARVRFVYAGTLGSGYDIQTLLKAAAILEARKALVQIVIAGDGYWRTDVEAAAKAISSNYLAYVGRRLNPTELHHIYKESQVGLCAYVRDSTVAMPSKFYDYVAEGLAIVSSLRGELADLIKDERFGLQYEAGSADSLADTICRIEGDRKLLQSFRRNAKAAAAQFDSVAQYDKVVKLIKDLLAEAKGSRNKV